MSAPPPEIANRCEFSQRFPDEDSARIYFENKKWPNGRCCPHCESTATAERKNSIPMPYRCKSCRKHFSVRTKSVLAESRLPLRTWLLAIYILTTTQERITTARLARELGTTRRSALRLRTKYIKLGVSALELRYTPYPRS